MTTITRSQDPGLDASFEVQADAASLHFRETSTAEARAIVSEAQADNPNLQEIAPISFAIASDPRIDLNDPKSLIERCVEITPVVHPLMDARLTMLGMERLGPRTYAIGAGAEGNQQNLLKILKALPSQFVTPPKVAEKFSQSGIFNTHANSYAIINTIAETPIGREMNRQAIQSSLYPNGLYYRGRADAMNQRFNENITVALSASATQIYVKFVTCFDPERSYKYDPVTVPRYQRNAQNRYETVEVEMLRPVKDKGFRLWEDSPDFNLLKFKVVKDPIRTTPAQAAAVAERLEAFGWMVEDRGGLDTIRRIVPNKIIAERVPGSPGKGNLIIGKNLLDSIPNRSLKTIRDSIEAPMGREVNNQGDLITVNTNTAPYKNAVTTATNIYETIDKIRNSRLARVDEDNIIIDEYLTDIVSMVSPGKLEFENLREYQNEMVNLHLATKIGAVNACSPGTGKTPTTLTGFRVKATAKTGWRGLAIVPASVRSQWLAEAETWMKTYLPNMEIRNFTPKELRKSYSEWMLDAGDNPALVVLSYQQAAAGLDQLVMYDYDDIVCDEAAILSNRSSSRSKALWILRECCETAIATTGTPIGSSLDSLGEIIAWTRNERDAFDGNKFSKRFDMAKDGDDLKLIEAVGPTLFRRDASVIADQMPHIENSVVILDPHPAEKRLADGARDELKAIIELLSEREAFISELDSGSEAHVRAQDELRKVRGALLGGVTIARKAASDPESLIDSESAGIEILKSSGLLEKAIRNGGTKRNWVKDQTVQLVGAGEAILIFSDFVTVAERLAKDLRDSGLRVGTWFGKNIKQREIDKEKFMNSELDVMVLTGAGREGLNLQRASALIHYDLPWVPTQVIQRVGRAARFGSTAEHLKIFSPVMRDTIEERVASVLVPRAVEALIALDRHRGVAGSDTDIGQAIGGLDTAISDETKEKSDKGGLIALANEVLGS